jgi:hypothetical protein
MTPEQIIPQYFKGEKEAVDIVIRLGEQWGYGNLISHIKRAWSQMLQDKWGIDKYGADMAAGIICVWCKTDSRTGKKVRK